MPFGIIFFLLPVVDLEVQEVIAVLLSGSFIFVVLWQ